MEDKTGDEILLEHLPALKIWYNVILLYAFQIMIFISVMLLFWWISSLFLFGAFIGEFIIIFCGTFPYRYIAINIDKIREKYKKKYGKLASQYLWFNYESYTIPLLSSSLYFPLLLKQNYYIFSAIIPLQSHIITNNILPEYLAIPLGIIIVMIGFLIRRPSGGFGPEVETYLNLLYPEKSKLITGGIYQYIRNPRYLGQGFVAIGFGIIANNILAIGVGLIHSLVFCSLITPEDDELHRRFGSDFDKYQKIVPALFPKYGNWKKFIKYIFFREKH